MNTPFPEATLPATGPIPRTGSVAAYSRREVPAFVDLRLDGNEGAATCDLLRTALAEVAPEDARRYPEPAILEEVLAARHGVAREQVLVTAGADEALDRVFRAYGGPGRTAVLLEPTFEMIPRYAALSSSAIAQVPWPDGPFPEEEILRSSAGPNVSVVCVVSPNNPTGLVAPADAVRRIADARPDTLVVLDLAYVEYADTDPTHESLGPENVLVVRTLSKAQGLAGLRIGYAIGPARCVAAMRAAGSPYPVSGPSLTVAIRLLHEGEKRACRHVAAVRRERTILAARLRAHGLEVPSSQANFVHASGERAEWLADALQALGILVRRFGVGAGTRLRITCPGDASQFDRLCEAVDTALDPEAILFDVDGVLADVSRSYREAIRATARAFGIELTQDDIREIKAEGNANNDWEVTRRALERRGVTVPLAEITERFEEIYQGTPGSPGLREQETCCVDPHELRSLAASIPVAVVTGRPRADADHFLERSQLASTFSARICMEDATPKPSPAPVRGALAQLGVRRAWLLGDTPDDVVAARGAGVVAIGVVAPGDGPEAARRTLLQAGAARVLTSLAALPTDRSRLFDLLESR